MQFDRTFRFGRDSLNARLHTLVEASGIPHQIENDGQVRFHSGDEARIERFLGQVRNTVFTDWQVLSFPPEWETRYRTALADRALDFEEERNDGLIEFLLPAHATPHEWEFDSGPAAVLVPGPRIQPMQPVRGPVEK